MLGCSAGRDAGIFLTVATTVGHAISAKESVMPVASNTAYPRKPTNTDLAESNLAEGEVVKAIADKLAEVWIAESGQAFECWNAYVEKNGLPLAKYRSF